jgi:glutamate carboxypeptidase
VAGLIALRASLDYTSAVIEPRLRQCVVDHVRSRADAIYANVERAVAIPTGHDHVAGLNEYRELLAARLRAISATIEVVEGDARPEWPYRADSSSSGGRADVRHPILIARGLAPSRGRGALPPPQPTPAKRGKGRCRFLLCGHLDTVHDPRGPFQTLTRAPDGRTAVGPGAVDMKGGIEVALAALESLHACGVSPTWTFVLVSDEETGSFQCERVLRQLAGEHDVGLVFEPALPAPAGTKWGSLAIERMGSGQFMIEAFGASAHVGRDFEKGVSAVYRLARIIVELSTLSDATAGKIVNVGPIVGGSATNIVPDHAACWGNVRFATPRAGDELARAIDAFATTAPANDPPAARVVVRRAWGRPAKPFTPAVERLAILARDVARSLGQDLPFAKTGGVCDGNILQDAGLPTLDTLGVRGGNLHRTDEFIEIASLVERAQLLALLMLDLSASDDGHR